MKKSIFYSKIPIVYTYLLTTVFIVICVCTLGWCMRYYDMFIHPKYWLNRRVLYKYLHQPDLVFTKEIILNNIVKYKFNNFTLWYHTEQLNITVHNKYDSDLIGLFISSPIEDRFVIKLIRKLNTL